MTDTKPHEHETSEPVPQDLTPKYSTAVKTGGTATDMIGRLLWIGVLLGALLGLFNFVTTRYMSNIEINAPQLAALAAESLAIAILPYVLARAWDEVCRPPRWR